MSGPCGTPTPATMWDKKMDKEPDEYVKAFIYNSYRY